MNAMEGRAVKAALDKGDKKNCGFSDEDYSHANRRNPTTCICGAGCMIACPMDSRIRK